VSHPPRTHCQGNGHSVFRSSARVSGRADLVSFGRLFIANPDLVESLRENALLNPLMGEETFYGGGTHGYTDYPTQGQSRAATEFVDKAAA